MTYHIDEPSKQTFPSVLLPEVRVAAEPELLATFAEQTTPLPPSGVDPPLLFDDLHAATGLRTPNASTARNASAAPARVEGRLVKLGDDAVANLIKANSSSVRREAGCL